MAPAAAVNPISRGECNAEGEGRKVLLAEQLGKAEMEEVWRYIVP